MKACIPFFKKRSNVSYLILCIIIGGTLFSPLQRINNTPITKKKFYGSMLHTLDTMQLPHYRASRGLKFSWAKINITPQSTQSMAGYAPRPAFAAVHDSLYARLLLISNGSIIVCMVSFDLLIVPPILRETINELALKEFSKTVFMYYGATHTHNSVGGWDKSLLGRVSIGTYAESWILSSAQTIMHAIDSVMTHMKPGRIGYWEIPVHGYVENRLVSKKKPVDSLLRGFDIVCNDGSKGVLYTFSAHPTNINAHSLSLSGDYPAEVEALLLQKGFDFTIFMSGMVGDARFCNIPGSDFEKTRYIAGILSDYIIQAPRDYYDETCIDILASHIPILHDSPHMRILPRWRLHPVLFKGIAYPLSAEITVLSIGPVLLLGVSADFSGSIALREKYAENANKRGKKLIVTSFNGWYTGYIIDQSVYDSSKREEAYFLNWVGPYFDSYYSALIKKIIVKSTTVSF